MKTPRHGRHKTVTIALLAAASTLLAGCTVGPNYHRPSVPTAPTYRDADNTQTPAQQTASLGDQKWAEVFRDPQLQKLITTALTGNYDVQIAAKRILEQQAAVRVARAQEFPQITAGGTGLGAELPNSFGSQLGGDNPLSDGSVDLSVAWTPDFWGLYRRQTEAARATLLAQVWAQRVVRMSVVQSVATDYLQLRALYQQMAITKQTIGIRQQSVKLTQTLETGGSAPLSDVRQAEELLYTATAEVPQLEEQIQQKENAIRLLLGQQPGSIAEPPAADLEPPPQDLPTGIPSQLLERRPDIQEAEQQLVSANANIGVARAQFFPQFTLSASAGFGGDDLSTFFDPSNKTIYGLGSITQPIFEGGKLSGQLAQAKAAQQEMVLTYQKTIIGAFHDVSNALIALRKAKAYREQQEKLVFAAKDATRLARLRYQGGSTSYLEVLTTDATLFSDQLQLITAQESEALTLVQLYNALGGGWQQ